MAAAEPKPYGRHRLVHVEIPASTSPPLQQCDDQLVDHVSDLSWRPYRGGGIVATLSRWLQPQRAPLRWFGVGRPTGRQVRS
jgi:hypothetical protein